MYVRERSSNLADLYLVGRARREYEAGLKVPNTSGEGEDAADRSVEFRDRPFAVPVESGVHYAYGSVSGHGDRIESGMSRRSSSRVVCSQRAPYAGFENIRQKLKASAKRLPLDSMLSEILKARAEGGIDAHLQDLVVRDCFSGNTQAPELHTHALLELNDTDAGSTPVRPSGNGSANAYRNGESRLAIVELAKSFAHLHLKLKLEQLPAEVKVPNEKIQEIREVALAFQMSCFMVHHMVFVDGMRISKSRVQHLMLIEGVGSEKDRLAGGAVMLPPEVVVPKNVFEQALEYKKTSALGILKISQIARVDGMQIPLKRLRGLLRNVGEEHTGELPVIDAEESVAERTKKIGRISNSG